MIGVILAGGASRRMPGGKPAAVLGGRTLLARAVETVRTAGLEPVVCVREGVALPAVDAPVWNEPEHAGGPHPLRGIAVALRIAAAPAVLLPVDLPFLPAAALTALAEIDAPLAVLAAAGRPAALVLRAGPSHATDLNMAADADAPALRTLVALGAELVDIAPAAGPHALLNVNDPSALAEAERLLD